MSTTIINPPSGETTTDGMGYLTGIIVLIILVAIFLFLGLPYIKNMNNHGIQVNVPKNVDVTVRSTK
jgi:hypothetical protein